MVNLADKSARLAVKAVDQVQRVGVDGFGPVKGAVVVAEEAVAAARGDKAKAEERLVRTHLRLAGSAGFLTSVGGLVTLPAAIPASVGVSYVVAARLTASIAYLRGYDIDSDDVRSAILITMLGSAGTEVLKDVGIEIGTKSLAAGLKRVPGSVFLQINRAVASGWSPRAGRRAC